MAQEVVKVIAKYQLAYKGKGYRCGDVIEMSVSDFPTYQNDVRPMAKNDFRKPETKAVKPSKKSSKKSDKK